MLGKSVDSLLKDTKATRVAEIILGIITIGLAIFIISNPVGTTIFLLMILGYALIFVGISRIIAGFAQKDTSGSVRGIAIGTGILSIIGGIIAVSNPVGAIGILIMVISIFVMIHGFGLIGSGISTSGVSKGSRIAIISMGIVAVGFAGVLLAFPGLAVEIIVLLMSISLFFNGLGSILSGITGQRPITSKQ